MISIYKDKATIILRALLSQPKKHWTARELSQDFNISKSLAAYVLQALYKNGYTEGIRKGKYSYTILSKPKEVVSAWLKEYDFELNETVVYYSPKPEIQNNIKKYFQERNIKEWALTLHTGANLTTRYMRTDSMWCYIEKENFNEIILNIRQELDLKELKSGGNIFFIKPYYKNSIFMHAGNIRGFKVVSNLQLYLDLYNFPQRGKEHADYLVKVLKERNKISFA